MLSKEDITRGAIKINPNAPESFRARAAKDRASSLTYFNAMVENLGFRAPESSGLRELGEKFRAYRDQYTGVMAVPAHFDGRSIVVVKAEHNGKHRVGILLSQEYFVGFTSSPILSKVSEETHHALRIAVRLVDELLAEGREFMSNEDFASYINSLFDLP